MAKEGLSAVGYRDWIGKSICIDNNLNVLFSEFVVGSPAYKLSKKGRDLYSYYNYCSEVDYSKLRNALLSSVDTHFFETYKELKDYIIADSIMNFSKDLPEVLEEVVCIYIGANSDSKFYNQYFKKDKESNKGKKKEVISQESTNRRDTVAMDKLFCHIRNSLAHGCFQVTDSNNEIFIVMQDETNDECISGRIILKMSTLLNWKDYLLERKKSLVETIGE